MKKLFNLAEIALAILFFPISVFALHVLAVAIGAYSLFPWFDIPMHCIGGGSIAVSSFLFFRELHKRKQIGNIRPWVMVLLAVCLTTTMAVLWEFSEFFLDQHFVNLNAQVGLRDTMADLALGMIGGFIFSVALLRKK